MTKPLLAYSTASLSWGAAKKTSICRKLMLSEEHSLSVSGCFESFYMAVKNTLLSSGTPHPYLTLLTQHVKSIYVLLCSVFTVPFFLTVGLVFVFFPGTVWPSTRRLWKGSPVEWGEPQSTVQKSKIFEGDGETSRGLWGCCQMLSSSASGKV